MSEARSVVLNLTGTEPTSSTYITAFPADALRPTASNLNLVAGETRANLVIVRVPADGRIKLFNLAGATHLVADVVATFAPAADTTAASVVAIWPDGSTINVVVIEESGAVSLTAAQTFVADYLAAMSNHITVNISTTPVKWTGVDTTTVPLNTVVVRVDNSTGIVDVVSAPVVGATMLFVELTVI